MEAFQRLATRQCDIQLSVSEAPTRVDVHLLQGHALTLMDRDGPSELAGELRIFPDLDLDGPLPLLSIRGGFLDDFCFRDALRHLLTDHLLPCD